MSDIKMNLSTIIFFINLKRECEWGREVVGERES